MELKLGNKKLFILNLSMPSPSEDNNKPIGSLPQNQFLYKKHSPNGCKKLDTGIPMILHRHSHKLGQHKYMQTQKSKNK